MSSEGPPPQKNHRSALKVPPELQAQLADMKKNDPQLFQKFLDDLPSCPPSPGPSFESRLHLCPPSPHQPWHHGVETVATGSAPSMPTIDESGVPPVAAQPDFTKEIRTAGLRADMTRQLYASKSEELQKVTAKKVQVDDLRGKAVGQMLQDGWDANRKKIEWQTAQAKHEQSRTNVVQKPNEVQELMQHAAKLRGEACQLEDDLFTYETLKTHYRAMHNQGKGAYETVNATVLKQMCEFQLGGSLQGSHRLTHVDDVDKISTIALRTFLGHLLHFGINKNTAVIERVKAAGYDCVATGNNVKKPQLVKTLAAVIGLPCPVSPPQMPNL